MRLVSSIDPRARMLADQTVAIMDGRLQNKLSDKARRGLTAALTRVAVRDGLNFGSQAFCEPFREAPPRWTLEGLLARLTLRWKLWREPYDDDGASTDAEHLSITHFAVRRSGAAGLIVILLIALLIGAIKFGEPLELGLQMGRDALRRTAASGEIVVIAMDDRSAKAFGQWPWPRKYDALLVDRLREMGAKKIVYNVAFSEKTDPENDAAFAAALDRAKGKVWLGAYADSNSLDNIDKSRLPINVLLSRSSQVHYNIWLGMFGYIKYIPNQVNIKGIRYYSQASLLANSLPKVDRIIADYSITYKSVPTISAVDIAYGRVTPSAIAGKNVVVSVVGETQREIIPVPGQGSASRIYSVVIAAETIKRGIPWQMGFLIPLMLFAGFGFWCVISQPQRKRYAIIAGGGVVVVVLTLIGDRLGFRFEIVPALLALSIFAIREHIRRPIAAALVTHHLSGLPPLEHLGLVKGREDCAIVTVKLERFEQRIETLTIGERRPLYRGIAARINIIAPHHQVHQGDNGLFAFLIPPDSECESDVIVRQLQALFTYDVIARGLEYDVGASIGIVRETDLPFDKRLAVAIDRAEFTVFGELYQVV
jgi:diguanylate cyclase